MVSMFMDYLEILNFEPFNGITVNKLFHVKRIITHRRTAKAQTREPKV